MSKAEMQVVRDEEDGARPPAGIGVAPRSVAADEHGTVEGRRLRRRDQCPVRSLQGYLEAAYIVVLLNGAGDSRADEVVGDRHQIRALEQPMRPAFVIDHAA